LHLDAKIDYPSIACNHLVVDGFVPSGSLLEKPFARCVL